MMFDSGEFDEERRELEELLRDPRMWEQTPAAPRWWNDVAAFGASVQEENEHADALLGGILTGPAAWWPQRLRTTPGAQTAGMARALLRKMPAFVESRPADALQVTSMALTLGDMLDPEAYPHPVGVQVRAQALRDHAYVLSFLGRLDEALDHVERSEIAFAEVPCPYFDLARLGLVKASVLRHLDRNADAAELAREAAETFRAFGDRPRFVKARMTEAAVLYDGGDVERALDLWQSLDGDPHVDEVSALRLDHNIAVCLCDLGRASEALDSLRRCAVEFARRGMRTEAARARWKVGGALLITGRVLESIDVLRSSWRELDDLGMTVDASLAALDLAEALLASDAPAEVPSICRDVISRLTVAGMATWALPALAMLREAAELGRASRGLVRSTSATLRRTGS